MTSTPFYEAAPHEHPDYSGPGFSPYHPEHECHSITDGPCYEHDCREVHHHRCIWTTHLAPFHKCTCNFIWSDLTKPEADSLLHLAFSYMDMIRWHPRLADENERLCANAIGHLNSKAHATGYREETRAEFEVRMRAPVVIVPAGWRGRIIRWLAYEVSVTKLWRRS